MDVDTKYWLEVAHNSREWVNASVVFPIHASYGTRKEEAEKMYRDLLTHPWVRKGAVQVRMRSKTGGLGKEETLLPVPEGRDEEGEAIAAEVDRERQTTVRRRRK